MLRSLVASAVPRKKVPDFAFRLAGPEAGPPAEIGRFDRETEGRD